MGILELQNPFLSDQEAKMLIYLSVLLINRSKLEPIDIITGASNKVYISSTNDIFKLDVATNLLQTVKSNLLLNPGFVYDGHTFLYSTNKGLVRKNKTLIPQRVESISNSGNIVISRQKNFNNIWLRHNEIYKKIAIHPAATCSSEFGKERSFIVPKTYLLKKAKHKGENQLFIVNSAGTVKKCEMPSDLRKNYIIDAQLIPNKKIVILSIHTKDNNSSLSMLNTGNGKLEQNLILPRQLWINPFSKIKLNKFNNSFIGIMGFNQGIIIETLKPMKKVQVFDCKLKENDIFSVGCWIDDSKFLIAGSLGYRIINTTSNSASLTNPWP